MSIYVYLSAGLQMQHRPQLLIRTKPGATWRWTTCRDGLRRVWKAQTLAFAHASYFISTCDCFGEFPAQRIKWAMTSLSFVVWEQEPGTRHLRPLFNSTQHSNCALYFWPEDVNLPCQSLNCHVMCASCSKTSSHPCLPYTLQHPHLTEVRSGRQQQLIIGVLTSGIGVCSAVTQQTLFMHPQLLLQFCRS